MPKDNYFAYGSNLWQPRLERRVGKVEVAGTAFIQDFELRWHKRSVDRSGKADIAPASGRRVYGVVYRLTRDQLTELDAFEGVGKGYSRAELVATTHSNERLTVVTYRADADWVDASLVPYDWYVAFVIAGARAHELPESYIQGLEGLKTKSDSNATRSAQQRAELNG